MAVAALFAVLRLPTPHLALMFWLSKPSVRLPLRVFRSGVDRIITWSSVQRDVAVERIRVPARTPSSWSVIRWTRNFSALRTGSGSILFSAGSTQRDFDTLVAAARGLGMPRRIAAPSVVALDGFKVTTTDVRQELDTSGDVEVESLDSIAASVLVCGREGGRCPLAAHRTLTRA